MSFLNNIVFLSCEAKRYILRIKYEGKATHPGLGRAVMEKERLWSQEDLDASLDFATY